MLWVGLEKKSIAKEEQLGAEWRSQKRVANIYMSDH